MPAPTTPIKKNSRPLRHRTWAAAVILILLHQPTHQLCIGNGGPQWADRRSAGLGHRAARRTWRPCRCHPRRGQLSERQRPCGSGSAPAPSYYKEKEFKNINSGDLGLETEDEKKAAEAAETENKDLFEEIKKDLNGKVKEVKVNPTLQEHPVTLSAEGGISMEMEKVLRRMPNAEGVESTKVLELNPNHTVFAALKAAHAAGDTDKVAKYAVLLDDQALLIAGLPIEAPLPMHSWCVG